MSERSVVSMERQRWHAVFEEELEATGLNLSTSQVGLAVTHAMLLIDANQRTNLTRITEPRDVARRHFVESFLSAGAWGEPPPPRRLRVLDVGTGGGFPGLAARIVRPDVDLTCLEPRAVKAAFLSRVAAGLPPPIPRVLSVRLEAFHVEQRFDVITFRALHLPARLLELPLSPEGRIVGFPGGDESWSSALDAGPWLRISALALPDAGREIVAWGRKA